MKRALTIGMVALSLVGLSARNSQATTINFDNLTDGTVIDSLFSGSGVTFSNAIGGSVYAQDAGGFAPSGSNVVSVLNGGLDSFFDGQSGAVKATFSTLQSTVSIDARAVGPVEFLGTLQNRPYLQAYDINGNFLQQINYSLALPTGC